MRQRFAIYIHTLCFSNHTFIIVMQHLNKLIFVLVLLGFRLSVLQAQTTILDQTLLTQESFNTFTPVSVRGAQTWGFRAIYGAVCSGYAVGQSYENEDWLVSPVMDLSQTENAELTFNHTRGNAAVMNVGVEYGWYEVFATANFTGNPLTTQWVALEGLNQNISTAWQYVSSGVLVIPDAARSENSRIAFRYISTETQSATWEIKNVKVTDRPDIADPGSDAVLKITNWNTEWLGCELNGPTNESLQINNVVSAMLLMNSDIYCLQEVSNTVLNPSIETLVSLLGEDQWGGTIVPADTGDCNQRQGIIYKKSKVQFVSAVEMNSGRASQGNSYNYNWSGGRFPALYNVNLVAGNTLIPISLVNIHAKAEDGNAMSYTRRKGASESLKTILDGTNYNTKNLIIIGDFNDYLTGTTSIACDCTISPYNNFMDDEINYTAITGTITDVDTRWGTHPIIEHIIISNELTANYVENSAAQEVTVLQNIFNYDYTTSNHLPVSASLQFSTLNNTKYTENSWTVYPNPVKDKLYIQTSTMIDDTALIIYDLTGRQMLHDKLSNNAVDVSLLPAGIYVMKIGNKSGKFVKQ